MTIHTVGKTRNQCALIGADARLKELEQEVASIHRAFPELTTSKVQAPRKDGRSNWSPKRKREHAERMRKFWAKRSRDKHMPKSERAHSRTQAKKWDGYIAGNRHEQTKTVSRKATAK